MAEKQLNPIIDLLEFDFSSFNIEDFRKFIHVDNFTGPSLYFHKKAIEMARNDLWFLSNRHIEYIYATLASWGMHRMGSRGAKMPYFEKVGNEEENHFKESILKYKESFLCLRNYKSIVSVSEEQFNNILPELTKICFKISALEILSIYRQAHISLPKSALCTNKMSSLYVGKIHNGTKSLSFITVIIYWFFAKIILKSDNL